MISADISGADAVEQHARSPKVEHCWQSLIFRESRHGFSQTIMPKILKISVNEIDYCLSNVTRQYLVGDLQKAQRLQHVPSSLIEIGITRYASEDGLEPPHTHKQAFEFQYMISGRTAYLDITTGEEHVFRKGDFYVIEPGVVYSQKSAPDTEILFIKVPPGNDKVPVDTTPEVEAWFQKPIED